MYLHKEIHKLFWIGYYRELIFVD